RRWHGHEHLGTMQRVSKRLPLDKPQKFDVSTRTGRSRALLELPRHRATMRDDQARVRPLACGQSIRIDDLVDVVQALVRARADDALRARTFLHSQVYRPLAPF